MINSETIKKQQTIEFFKGIFTKKLWLSGSITYCLAFATVIVMAFYYWFLPPFMIIWGVVWILEHRIKHGTISPIKAQYKLLFILFSVYFVWQILGMLYSDNPKEGWRNIELRLSLFLFPMVLVSPGEMIQNKVKTLLRLFSFCTFIYVLFCFGYAFYRSIHLQNGVLIFNPHLPDYKWLNYFYGSDLSFIQHPSYLSMYALFSVFIGFESFFDKALEKGLRFLWLGISTVLLVSIYFLSSRAGILASILIVPLYFFRKFRIIYESRYVYLGIILGLLILLPVFLTNPRMKNYFKMDSEIKLRDLASKEERILIWNAAFNLIPRNFIFGVGTGDIQSELNKEYYRIGNTRFIEENRNTHNQFIEVLIENGIIGLVLFLSTFGMMFYMAYTERNLIFLVFLLLVFISFLFETMLNRLAGVSFFAFFSFLLIHHNTNRILIPDTR